MSDITINSLPTANTIDETLDYLPIYTASSAATQKITRDTYLGIASQPLGLTDTQSPTNKTLGNTNTITLKDTLFTLQDNSDTTKQAQFQLSGITTGTTRTYTLPDADATLVGLATTQTLTNKILTSPTINSPTITNATISSDSYAGYSDADSGSIYGVTVTNAVIQGTPMADSSILPKNLLTGTGSTWVWQSWAPTTANLSGGTLNYAKYTQIGKTVHFRFKYTLASAGVSGALTITIPITANSDLTGDNIPVGTATMLDTGTQGYFGYVILNSTTVMEVRPVGTGGSYATFATAVSSTIPHTWASGDQIIVSGSYEAA